MGLKIDAAIEFLEAGGIEVLITSPELIGEAEEGRAGTRIYRNYRSETRLDAILLFLADPIISREQAIMF
jgi:hypothetical protein